jgi:hypothetical protein
MEVFITLDRRAAAHSFAHIVLSLATDSHRSFPLIKTYGTHSCSILCKGLSQVAVP